MRHTFWISAEAVRPRCLLTCLLAAALVATGGPGLSTSLSAADEAPQAEFTGALGYGFAVAMSTGGSTAVVGQIGDSKFTDVPGVAHVLTFDGSSWTQQAELTAGDSSYDMLFGNAVAVSADGNTVIVGDPGECGYGLENCEHGVAYVFTRSGSTWTQQAELHGGPGFGGAVALGGDGNTALVGAGLSGFYGLSYAPGGNAPPTIFSRSDTTWTQEATLSASDASGPFDNFGHAVALSADGNTALIGDPGENEDAGSAYVFTGAGSTWTQQAELTGSDVAKGWQFGASVALSADGHTALVGAPAPDAGSAYVFSHSGSSWTQQAELTPDDAEVTSFDGWFGDTVALDGEGNIALVGAPWAEEDLGAAYAFAGDGSSWTQQAKFILDHATPYDYFGDAVALNGLGTNALIGRYDPGAYIFRVPPAHFAEPPVSTKPPVATAGAAQTSTTSQTSTSASGGVATTPGDGSALSLAGAAVAAETVSVHVQRKLAARQNVHITFHGRRLPEGGYYYGVIVLKPYKKYTRTSPPPCATSSDMQRTDYGYPHPSGEVALALTPAKSPTGHWCPGGDYLGAIYAVPHAPPCESTYPCHSEPYKEPCAGIGPGCITGVVAPPRKWAYPQGLPTPRASGATIVGHFTVRFPATPRPRTAPRTKAARH